jgi:DNA-binding transcriptional MerR regulator/methylmalonyl-CoA mutase cobalamin-binding subunit
MDRSRYAIQTAARLSGLTPFVLRAWEKRYDVPRPARTATNRRLYSDADVEYLTLLRKLTEGGIAISGLVKLPDAELRALLRKVEEEGKRAGGGTKDYAGWRAALMHQAQRLDSVGLERSLREAERQLSRRAFIDHVVGPFMSDIGSNWREGRVRIVQEHHATSIVRTVLVDLLRSAVPPSDAERVISATPGGQHHELGVLLAGLAASTAGRVVTHLGADLPAEEIAAAARDLGASEILLSIVYPPDDTHTFSQLVELVRLLPSGVRIVIGGASAPAYLARLDATSILYLESTSDLWDHYAVPMLHE